MTTTRLLARSSSREHERPGNTSPPLTSIHWWLSPEMLTDSRAWSPNSTRAALSSRRVT
jgi:hypothetical protein